MYDRIRRIDKQDSLIIEMPRLSIDERKQLMSKFFDLNRDSLDQRSIDQLIYTETGESVFKLSNEFSPYILDKWNIYKTDQILEKAESFCNLRNINIESSTLWTDKKITTLKFNFNDETVPKKKKAWWKFW